MAHFSIIVFLVHDHHLDFKNLANQVVTGHDFDVSLWRRVPENALYKIDQHLLETDLVSDQSVR